VINTASSLGNWQLLGKLFEIDPSNQLHRDEEHASNFSEVVGLYNVGVNEVGDQFCLTNEVINEGVLVGVILADHLDGNTLHEVTGAVLFGLIDHAHAAFEYLAYDLVPEFIFDREESHAAAMLRECHLKVKLVLHPGRKEKPAVSLENMQFSTCAVFGYGFNTAKSVDF